MLTTIFAAVLFGEAKMGIVEIGSGGVGVVLYGDAWFGGSLEDGVDVDGVGIALEDFCDRWGARGCGC